MGAIIVFGTVALGGCSNNETAANNDRPAVSCRKLAVADVQPYFGAPVIKKYAGDLTESLSDCVFATTTAHSYIDITVESGSNAETSYDVDAQKRGQPAELLTGIGDKAEREPGDVWVSVLQGDMFCRVHGDEQGRRQLKGVERYAGRPVPNYVAGPVAMRLGALCSKIFGS